MTSRFLTSVLYSLEQKQTRYPTTYEPDTISIILPFPTEKHTLPPLPTSTPAASLITLTVKILKPSQKLSIDISSSSSVSQLKQIISEKSGVAISDQRVLLNGKVLAVGLLVDLGVVDGCLLNMTVKKAEELEVKRVEKWDSEVFYEEVKGVVAKHAETGRVEDVSLLLRLLNARL